MNKRRRYLAKRRRRIARHVNIVMSRSIWKVYLRTLNEYINKSIPYTQVNQSTDSWLGFERVKNDQRS